MNSQACIANIESSRIQIVSGNLVYVQRTSFIFAVLTFKSSPNIRKLFGKLFSKYIQKNLNHKDFSK